MYSLVYGTDGVIKAAEILKHELTINAQNLGLGKLGDIDVTYVSNSCFLYGVMLTGTPASKEDVSAFVTSIPMGCCFTTKLARVIQATSSRHISA